MNLYKKGDISKIKSINHKITKKIHRGHKGIIIKVLVLCENSVSSVVKLDFFYIPRFL
jgi:hypothetical protein